MLRRWATFWAILLVALCACFAITPAVEGQTPPSAPPHQPPPPPRIAVWSMPTDDASAHERATVRAVRRVMPTGTDVTGDCDPNEPRCITRLAQGVRATVLVTVQLEWERAGCAPTRRDGETVGHRMLRQRVLRVVIYDESGAQRATTSVPITDATEPSATARAVRTFLDETLQ